MLLMADSEQSDRLVFLLVFSQKIIPLLKKYLISNIGLKVIIRSNENICLKMF